MLLPDEPRITLAQMPHFDRDALGDEGSSTEK
jgi:hypothetical protein